MGYVICRTPRDIIDYGLGYLKILAPNYYVKRLCKFIETYKPHVIVLKDYGEGLYMVKPRVRKVIEAIENVAYKEGLTVHRYSRSEMIKIFSQFGETNKFGISLTLSRWYPNLEHLLAPKRTLTKTEDYYMGIFDAHALMCTHFATISPNKEQKHELESHQQPN
ncbi:hypothetical protein [Pseudotenacibaculum haliotis]|uniref:Terminase large subunit gp17-like C-terminal domain-containing protein n=1 Tax=Pseudotenacibaculum haliotis TaxID=1862138 RepID=A0ABW5LM31_9FLAO